MAQRVVAGAVHQPRRPRGQSYRWPDSAVLSQRRGMSSGFAVSFCFVRSVMRWNEEMQVVQTRKVLDNAPVERCDEATWIERTARSIQIGSASALQSQFGSKNMRRWIIVLLVLAAIPIAGGAFAWYRLSHGVRVTVTNNGPEPMSNVVAHVTGNTHLIGGLAVGEARTFCVLPASKSHLELSFDDHLRQEHRLNAGGYFESGYRMNIEVDIQNNVITRNDQEYLSMY